MRWDRALGQCGGQLHSHPLLVLQLLACSPAPAQPWGPIGHVHKAVVASLLVDMRQRLQRLHRSQK
jgi:hypothetical protein